MDQSKQISNPFIGTVNIDQSLAGAISAAPSARSIISASSMSEGVGYSDSDMLFMRLRKPAKPWGLLGTNVDLVGIRRLPSSVAVFLLVDDKPVVLEDGPDLFPSDALITRMRLMGC